MWNIFGTHLVEGEKNGGILYIEESYDSRVDWSCRGRWIVRVAEVRQMELLLFGHKRLSDLIEDYWALK